MDPERWRTVERLYHAALERSSEGRREFLAAASALAQMSGPVCIMCAESNPADCHRLFISDWLVSRGHQVVHLLGLGERREHPPRLF